MGHYPLHCLITHDIEYKELVTALKRRKYHDWVKAIEGDDHFYNDHVNRAMFRSLGEGEDEDKFFFILLKKNVNLDDESYAVIAHECFHVVQFVSECVGADICAEKESSAYLHMHLMKACIKLVRE